MAHLCVNKWDAERSHSEDDANESRSEILTPCALVVLSEIYDRVRGERDAFFAPTLRTATPFVITTYSFERFSSPIVLSPTYGATVGIGVWVAKRIGAVLFFSPYPGEQSLPISLGVYVSMLLPIYSVHAFPNEFRTGSRLWFKALKWHPPADRYVTDQ